MNQLSLLLVCLLFSTHGLAARSLTPGQFQVHIRPGLSSIIKDFYQAMSLFPSFSSSFSEMKNKIQDTKSMRTVLITCPRKEKPSQCLGPMEQFLTELKSLELMAQDFLFSPPKVLDIYSSHLFGRFYFQKFAQEVSHLRYNIESEILLLEAQKRPKTNWDPYRDLKKLDDLSVYLDLAVIEFVPFTYQQDFRYFFFNFIHPLEKNLDQINSHVFFEQNISQLNFCLNLLIQNLTKRNKKTPQGMSPYLTTIHNRWNEVLKYYF